MSHYDRLELELEQSRSAKLLHHSWWIYHVFHGFHYLRLYCSIRETSSWSFSIRCWRRLIDACINEKTRSAGAEEGSIANMSFAALCQAGSMPCSFHHWRREWSSLITTSSAAATYAGSSSFSLLMVMSFSRAGRTLRPSTCWRTSCICLACYGHKMHTAL